MSKEELEEVEIINIPLEDITRDDCDSDEEWWFTCYLREMKEHGIIDDADKNLTEVELLEKEITHLTTRFMKTKEKPELQHLMGKYVYTPDFNIKWNREWRNVIYSMLNRGKQFSKDRCPFVTFSGMFDASIIEVKGSFTKSSQMYATNLKRGWLYDKRQMFVQLVKIPELFNKTFTPKAYYDDNIYKIGAKKGESKLKYKNIIMIEEYIEQMSKIKEKADLAPV